MGVSNRGEKSLNWGENVGRSVKGSYYLMEGPGREKKGERERGKREGRERSRESEQLMSKS